MSSILSSLIIINWNTEELLIQCLKSVFAHPPPDAFEVWVVDNDSSDDSMSRVKNHFPNVHLIENAENIGFAAANNQAMKKSSGKYLILLNPDTILEPDGLPNLIAFMEANPAVGAAGPFLLNPDRTLQESCYPIPNLAREFWRLFHLDRIFPFGRYAMSTWSTETSRAVGAVKGACLVLRRAAVEQVGMFDADYFMYTEEIDLCFRLHEHGWPTYWVPTAKVIHLGGQSTKKTADAMFLALYRSKLMFFRKHHGRAAAILYKGILILASISRLIYLRLSSLIKPDSRVYLHKLSHQYRELVHSIHAM